jgi:hypothetical protein
VTRLAADGTAQSVPAGQLRAGDRILVAAGERLRLDAVLAAGEALLDASATTGESLPRHVAAGEALPAGAVNMGAPFVATVTAAAADGSLATMARLLERALSFAPDALVANGDHVYWDQRRQVGAGTATLPEAVTRVTGVFAREQPLLGGPNEAVLKRAVGPQIAPLYGARCRSVPDFFMQDDHDHFENDEATDRLISFPPDPFMLAAARASQALYYPAFLPDATRPLGLGSTRADGISESFGTLRYGKLLEVLMYDCRRFMSGGAQRQLPARDHRGLAEAAHGRERCGAPDQRALHPAGLERGQVGRVVCRPGSRRQADDGAPEALLAKRLARPA